jgi:hypothetical protein
MRKIITDTRVHIWLSPNETQAWAHRPGAAWPCSFLSNRRLYAEFDSNGLCDLLINSGRGDQDCPNDEFSAIVSDHLLGVLPKDHLLYFIIIGQFERGKS